MSRVKIKLADNIARVIFIEKDATIGAQIGTDLRMPDGTLATASKLSSYLGIEGGSGVQDHRLLRGLTLGDDHPQYTRKDTLTTRGDLYVRGVTTVERKAVGTAGQLLRSDGTDPLWTTLSPVITLGTDLSGSATLTNLASATLNGTIVNNAVTDAKLRDSAALSVIGRSANTSGDPADIAAGTDTHVLRRSGTTIGFGLISVASITFAATARVLGRSTAGSGVGEELTLTQVLDMVGSAARGDILYRGASTWSKLTAGTTSYVLTTHGAGNDPTWDVIPAAASELVYANASVPAANTVANTTTETAFNSSYTVALASLAVGTVLRVTLFGTYSTDAIPPTLRLRGKVAGTTVIDTTAFTATASITDKGWKAEYTIIITTAGASGEVEAQGLCSFQSALTTVQAVHMSNTAKVSVNLSGASALTVTAQWSVADTDNSIKLREMLVSLAAVTTVDPTFSLLHFDGTDTSTTITDQFSPTWTAVGNAQLDTAIVKFGTAALLLDGTGDYVEMNSPGHAFGTGDFTMEGFVRYQSPVTGNRFMFGFAAGWAVYAFSNAWAVFDGVSTNVIGPGGTMAVNTWYHVALSRTAGTLRLFVDGVIIGSVANSTNHTATAFRIGSGTAGGATMMAGSVDEVRLSNTGLYTANFTPPSAAFPPP